jgi:hypothetical protein
MSCERDFFTLKLRVKSLPLATIYEVKIPLRKWKKSLLQRNPAQMTSAIVLFWIACRSYFPRGWGIIKEEKEGFFGKYHINTP